MFDLGWSELLIIGVVALVVVGPKDLPKMFRTLGQLIGKARAMAREFQRAMESAADDAGVSDLTKAARDVRSTMSGRNLKSTLGLDELDREMDDIDREMRGLRSTGRTPPAAGPQPDEAGDDAIIAAEHDADLARRNATTSAVEAERLKRQAAREDARRKAADLRARREAEGQSDATPGGPAQRPATGTRDAPTPAPGDAGADPGAVNPDPPR